MKNTKNQLKDLDQNAAPKGDCVLECVANQTKIYKGNGIIDHVTLKRFFMNSVSGNREWGNIVARAVDLCVNESTCNSKLTKILINFSFPARIMYKNFNVSRSKSFDGEIICHPISGYIFGCLQTEIFVKCTNFTASADCDALQQYAMGCHLGFNYGNVGN